MGILLATRTVILETSHLHQSKQHAGPAKFVMTPAYDMLPMQYAPDAQGSIVPEFCPVAAYLSVVTQIDGSLVNIYEGQTAA